MREIISFLLIVLVFAGCGDKDSKNLEGFNFAEFIHQAQSEKNDALDIISHKAKALGIQNLQSNKGLTKIYMLEGEINGQKAIATLKISSLPQHYANDQESTQNNIVYIFGTITKDKETFALSGGVDSTTHTNTQSIRLSIDNSPMEPQEDKIISQPFEAYITQQGELSATFTGGSIFADSTKIHFKKPQDKISEIDIIHASVMQESESELGYKSFEVATEIPIINKMKDENLALEKINNVLEEIVKQVANSIDSEDIEYSFESTLSFNPKYIDEKILVFELLSNLYTGGAHGFYDMQTLAFDIASGNLLPNDPKKLLKDTNDPMLRTVVKQKLAQQYKEGELFDENPTLSRFIITPNGVEFYWGIYEIAPYVSGMPNIYFDFSEIAPFVNEHSPYCHLFKPCVQSGI